METLSLPPCDAIQRPHSSKGGSCCRHKGTWCLTASPLGSEGSFSPASGFTFHRFYGRGCASQQPFSFFFPPRNPQQVQDCGGYLQEKARLQGRNPSTLLVLLSPAEVKAILLIIGYTKSLYKHRSPSRNPAVRFSSATHPKAFRAGKLQGYHVFPDTVLKVIRKQLSHCLEHP